MTPLIYALATLIAVGIIAWFINLYRPLPENPRRIFNVVLGLIAVGVFLWLVNTYVPMAVSIKAILNIVVVVATCVRVLQAVGLWSPTVRLWDDLTHRRIAH